MANELAVKVKVNLDSSGKALDDQLKNVEKYTTDHPVKVAVKIDKKSLENSLREAFGKDAANSIKTNLKNAVNVGELGKGVFDNIIKGADELAEKAQKAQKILSDMRKAQDNEKYYSQQISGLGDTKDRTNELDLWQRKVADVRAEYENLFEDLKKIDESKFFASDKYASLGERIAEEKELYEVRKQDAALMASQSAVNVTSKFTSDEIKEEKAAIEAVVDAQKELTASRVRYNTAVKSGNADNQKLYGDEVTKNIADLQVAKDAADKLGVSWRTDKEYLDAVHEGQVKVTESANTLAAAQTKTFDDSKATAIRNIVAAINEEAEATAKAYNAERTGNTQNKSLYENEANHANAKQLQLLADYQAKYHESALQNVDVNNALASSVLKTTTAYNDLQAAQGKSVAKDKVADIREIVDAINAETDATLKSIEAEKQGNTANKALYDAEATKANLEQTKLMQRYIIKYNESAKQTVEVNEAIADGVKKISVATNQVDFEKEKAAIKSLTDAVKAQTDAQIAYDKAKLSGKTETTNAKYSDLQDAKAKTDAARQAADQLGISWLKNKEYIDAVNESQRKYNSEMNNFNASAIDKQRIADLNQIVKLINEEADANVKAEKARQSGNKNSATDAEQNSIKASNEAVQLMADYQKKYQQSAMQTKEVNDAVTAGLEKMKTAQAGVADAQAKANSVADAKAEKEALDAVISALERRNKLVVQKNNELKSGKAENANRIQSLIDDANKDLKVAIQNANALGVAFRQDEQYIKAVNEGLVKVANSEQDVRRAQSNSSFKEKEADAKAAAEAINAYADANKKLIDAQRTGDERNESFYTTDAAQKQIAAQKLIDQYEQKYGESVTDNVTILKALQSAFEKNTVAQNKYVNSVDEANKANTLAKASMDNYINSANTSIRNLTENYGKFGISMTDVTAKYQALEIAVNNAVNNGNEATYLKEVTQCYKELGTAIAAATAEGQRYNNRLNNKKGFDNISAELDRFVNKNPNLSSNGDLWKQIRYLDTAVKNYSGTLEENQAAMAHVKAQAEALGLTTETLGQKFTRLWKEHAQTAAVMAGLHLVQQGMRQVYQSVVEVDTAMTELKKVTDETDASYANFTKRAAQQSRELGASISDYIKTTADWARLGYNLPDAEELARVSSLYANVGDGIESASQASEYLISTLKGFDLAASDAERVVDIINQVANTEPVSAQDLSEIMKRSSAALDAANTSFEKTVALGTAMNSVLQDSATTGTALKTLSMYLRATKTELEASGEDATYCASSMSKLRDSILGLTKGQVDIQLDED